MEDLPNPPYMLQPYEALGWSTALAALYVAPFYVLIPARLQRLSRNDPEVILRRMLCVGLSSILSIGVVVALLVQTGRMSWTDYGVAIRYLGLSLSGVDLLGRIALPLMIMALLFSGPILLEVLYLPRLNWRYQVVGTMQTLAGWRTYIVGPVTEEIVFRSCVMIPLTLAGYAPATVILTSPLFFGLAHLHHARDTYIMGGRTRDALRHAILQCTVQFTYTSLFGLYAATALVYTGSLYGSIVCHTVCNVLGLPDPSSARMYPQLKLVIWAVFLVGPILFFAWGLPTLVYTPLQEGSPYILNISQ